MKVVLKNVKLFEGHDTMTGFNADIYIEGVKCMHVHDSANGGCYDYNSFAYHSKNEKKIRELSSKLEAYVLTLPDIKHEHNGHTSMLKMDLDLFIDNMVTEYEVAKAAKASVNRMKRIMKKQIVFGVPDSNKYSSYDLFKATKKELKDLPKHFVQKYINIAKEKCVGTDKVILNTNLVGLGLVV